MNPFEFDSGPDWEDLEEEIVKLRVERDAAIERAERLEGARRQAQGDLSRTQDRLDALIGEIGEALLSHPIDVERIGDALAAARGDK